MRRRLGFSVSPNACQKGIQAFEEAAPTVDAYYNGWLEPMPSQGIMYHKPLFNFVYEVIAPAAMGDVDYLAMVLNSITEYGGVARFFAFNYGTTIFYAHTPETYYAYIVK